VLDYRGLSRERSIGDRLSQPCGAPGLCRDYGRQPDLSVHVGPLRPGGPVRQRTGALGQQRWDSVLAGETVGV